MCVCARVRARARARVCVNQGERERERERKCVCVQGAPGNAFAFEHFEKMLKTLASALAALFPLDILYILHFPPSF